MSRKEVAKLAGVSEATVSRVMNNVGPIKEETRDKVMKAAAELGYEINALAQQLARQKSGNIGVVLPYVSKVHLFSTYYFSEILSGIAEVATKQNIDLLMIFQEPEGAKDYGKWFRSKKIDACIILGATDTIEERKALQELESNNYPFVMINQRFENMQYAYVDGDHVAGSFAAVEHLIERGSTKIAMLNGPMKYSNSQDRYKGYLQALQSHKLEIRSEWLFEGNYSRKSGNKAAQELYQMITAEQVDAIFAANDRMAIGVMEGLTELGLEAGKHYRIIGYDDSDSAVIVAPKLSTIAVPFYEMGVQAAEMLLNQEVESKACILPVKLIIRQTS